MPRLSYIVCPHWALVAFWNQSLLLFPLSVNVPAPLTVMVAVADEVLDSDALPDIAQEENS